MPHNFNNTKHGHFINHYIEYPGAIKVLYLVKVISLFTNIIILLAGKSEKI